VVRHIASFTAFLGVVLLANFASWAAPAPNVFVKHLVNRGMAIIVNPGYSTAQREEAFGQLFSRDFDVPRISQFVVGRHWKGASEADRARFSEIYAHFVAHSLTEQLGKYQGEIVTVTGVHPKGNDETVDTDLIRTNGSPPTKLAWTVHCGGDNCKIVDVDVDGVSMLLTQREEFTSLIESNGGTVAGLTRALREKIGDAN
jgi:phospholipid transport system substrate-binding protein